MKAIVSIKKGLAMVLAAALAIGSMSVPADAADVAPSPEQIKLEVGDTETIFSATVSPDTATPSDGDEITFESPNDDVVRLSITESNGVKKATITALKEGTATITAKKDNAPYKIWNITVSAKTQIGLNKTEITLKEGAGSETLTAIVTPDSGNVNVTWTSNDPTIIVTPGDGKTATVAATKTGASRTATITATVKNVRGEDVKTSCTVKVTSDAVQVESVALNKTALALTVGGSETLTATILPENAANKNVTWTSSNPAVATVVDGKVTALAAGNSTITVKTVNGKTDTCTVTVTAGTTIPVTGVSIPATFTFKVGASSRFAATIVPENATNKNVTWTSSNPAVLTIDANTGIVKALAAGTAIITATTVDGGKTATCTVTVTADVAVTSVSVTKTLVVGKGATKALKATVAPANATNKNVTWKSSAPSVATVDARGNVKGIRKGTATITVTSSGNPNAKATCTVTVSEVTLNKTSLTLGVGKSSTALRAAVSTGADAVASWKTSNVNVVKVDSRTGKLTAGTRTGTATVTVTTKAGATATCKVTVKYVTTKLTMSSKKLELVKGKSATLKVKRTPSKATEKIRWSSSNVKVATVSQKGKVTAKKAGTVTITAKASNGVKATCKVTIKNKASLKLKKTRGAVKVGKSLKIQVKSTFPKNDKIKSYKSSDSKIAKVDKKGKVTGKKKGTAKITVTTKSGAKATYKVTVKK